MTENLKARLIIKNIRNILQISHPVVMSGTIHSQFNLIKLHGGCCCICMENYDYLNIQGVSLYSTCCSHQICIECVIEYINSTWLEKKDVKCPVCRDLLLSYNQN